MATTKPPDDPIADGYTWLEPIAWDQRCFGCGSNNPSGLHMQFFRKNDAVVSWLSIPDHLCGWAGVAHGGVICTILDEVMSWTAMHLVRRLILTRSMEVTFLKPVATGRRVKTVGRLESRINDRQATLRAHIEDESGVCCARSRGTFALFTVAAGRRMKVIDPAVLDHFERFIG